MYYVILGGIFHKCWDFTAYGEHWIIIMIIIFKLRRNTLFQCLRIQRIHLKCFKQSPGFGRHPRILFDDVVTWGHTDCCGWNFGKSNQIPHFYC